MSEPHREPHEAPASIRSPPGRSLRSIVSSVLILVAALALVVTAVLVGLAALLHRTTDSAAAAVESIRLTEEAEIDLLLHGRMTDVLARRDLEERLKGRLLEARQFVETEREERALAEAESSVRAYIESVRRPPRAPDEIIQHQEAAYGALEALVEVNMALVREAQVSANAWNRRANYLAVGVSALLLVGVGVVLYWLKSRAFAPIFALAAVMDRFGKGDRDARAEESGPAELREMSRRFNEMAAALAAQRQVQIASLGGVAHDLRNPLSVLKMSLALSAPDKPLPPEPRMRQLLERIARQINRLERMAGDFIDIASIEAGALDLKRETRDARALVGEVVALFQDMSPTPRLVTSVPSEPIELYCDHLRIEQVLTNLVSNAIKYSPAGSAVEVALEPSAREVVFRVTDHGMGIPKAEQQRVFEPFRRSGLSKESVPGVGLGLFVVRRIVEAHGGRIELESTPRAGSTFRVRLPRLHAGAAEHGNGQDRSLPAEQHA